MTVRGKAVKGSLLLTAGEGVVYGASFIRNMVLARMLTKADFGIAAAFAMIISLLEISARLGISRFLIRDKEGNDPDFVAAAQLMQVVGSALSALLILALARPLGLLFGIADQTWAIQCLALVPFLRGFEHLDVRRFERELRFGPSALVEVVPQVVITLAAFPVALWLKDFRAMLLLLLVKTLLSCLGSHLLAERRYRWQFHREYVGRMLRFGWPLVINGFLMFGVLQGNQFVVASFYDMGELGAFAAAMALTMAPTFFFGRVFNTVMLPVLAKAQDDPALFAQRYRKVIGGVCLFSAVLTVGCIVGAEALMRVAYGAKYAGVGVIFCWLAAANAFRNLRIAPALAALSKGDSQNEMYANGCRILALLPAVLLAWERQPLWMVAATGLLGEVLACWTSFSRLRRRHQIPLAANLVPAGLMAGLIAVAGTVFWVGGASWSILLALPVAAAAALLSGVCVVITLPAIRREVTEVVLQCRLGGWRSGLAALKGPRVKRETATS